MDYNASYYYVAQPDPSSASFISLALNIVLLVAWWKIFAKAGLDGWKSLIPFYSGYLQYKIAWRGPVFWQVLVLGFVGIVLGAVLITVVAYVGILVLGATVISLIVVQAKFCSRLATAFGKSKSFAVGLFFLNAIFTCILAFEKNEYLGPQE